MQEAILQRLQSSSGLDLKGLDVTTTAVNFDKNLAYATVAFHPKGDPNVNGGMTMKYTLEERDAKWVVVKVGDSQGRGLSGHGTGGHGDAAPGSLPAGHPSLDPGTPSGAAAPGRPPGQAQ